MILLKTLSEIEAWRLSFGNRTLSFVPTMGALHDGHLTLVKAALNTNGLVVVSIFINPGQFGPSEDFDRYPRTTESDIALLEGMGVDAVFLPTSALIYPNGYVKATRVKVPLIGKRLCGRSRPHFFEGVCSVVMRLISIIRPDYLVMGEKDFQQLQIIRQMCEDLFIPVQMIPVEIVRESDGIAMSSRNRFLSASARTIACHLYVGLRNAQESVALGETRSAPLKRAMTTYLSLFPEIIIDYIEIIDSRIQRQSRVGDDARLVVAVWIAGVRLIDNIRLTPK